MKKELSKKISLMLCSALFLPNLVGLSSVNANPTKLMGSSDTKRAVGVRRPRPSDSQETADNGSKCPDAPEKPGPVSMSGSLTLEEQQEAQRGFKNMFNNVDCPCAPKKKPRLELMFGSLTLEEQQELQEGFHNIGRPDTPTEVESVTAAVNFPVPEERRCFRDAFEVHPQRFSDSFMRFNERFVNLFVGLCQRSRIDRGIYNGVSSAGHVLDLIYSNRYLFQDGSFAVLMGYIFMFLSWDGSPGFVNFMNINLDRFAAENGLHS